MKRSLLRTIVALMLVFAVFMAAGCDIFGEETPPPEVPFEDFVGTWTGTTENGTVKKFSFSDNKKYTLTESKNGGSNTFSTGTFELDGNKLTLTPFETMAKATVHEITEFGDGSMVWGKGAVTVSFVKETKKKK